MTILILAIHATMLLPSDPADASKQPSEISLDSLRTQAVRKHGALGKQAAETLYSGMSTADRRQLTESRLLQEIDLCFQARREFKWGQFIPDEIFFNDVLPYAVFDETRDPFRDHFLQLCRPMVAKCQTASEAAQVLNRDLFKAVNVHYNTGRKRANQSWKESVASGRATCTGLSILLVNACRSVGIPARAVGTPMWSNLRGNHTWVEIWDGEWRFTGADEFDQQGLNRGWFVGDAGLAKTDIPKHAIYATSWRPAGLAFPMVWSPDSKSVHAVNVTIRYARTPEAIAKSLGKLKVRVVTDQKGRDTRVSAKVELSDAKGKSLAVLTSKSAPADLNDVAFFEAGKGEYRLAATYLGQTRYWQASVANADEILTEFIWKTDSGPTSPAMRTFEAWHKAPVATRDLCPTDPLSNSEAAQITHRLLEAERQRSHTKWKAALDAHQFVHGKHQLAILEKSFGKPPASGRSLWISMHGGGGTTKKINDQQWRNQLKLYEPAEGLYIAPRAPTDTWNLWHQDHIDPLFEQLIAACVAERNVNPNKVYLMGYSAGGDGVWQLAPRLADRFAAAAMMAGHPNDADLTSLRNLPFAIFMGGDDAAYNRNKVAREKADLLGRLKKNDPTGYEHLVRIYPKTGHWMNRQDAEALKWMAKFERDPWPRTITWVQDDVTHRRFYWLSVSTEDAVKNRAVHAEVQGQSIKLKSDTTRRITLLLSDQLLDLDQEIQVEAAGRVVFKGRVPRTATAIQQSINERFDPTAVATARLDVTWKP